MAVELAWDLPRQRAEVLGWLIEQGASAARLVTRRHGLPPDLAGDIASDAWIRAHETFERRTEAYPGMRDDVAVERYARRVLDNTAIDRSRLASNRREMPTVHRSSPDEVGIGLDELAAEEDDAFEVTASREALLQLRDAVGELAVVGGESCPGCQDTIVAATALRVANTLAAGGEPETEAGAGWLDALIYEALRFTDRATFSDVGPRLTDRQRQRKSRCGRCIHEILRKAARLIGLDR